MPVAKGKQFKRIELPTQSPEEVRAVVAKGERKANADRASTESEMEKHLGRLAREEKAHSRRTHQDLDLRKAQASDYKFMPNLSDYEHSRLQETQNRYDREPQGPKKEELRRTIGRAMQKGVVDSKKITHLACQTPNCGSSVSMEASKGDVICSGCSASGDKAGATYKDTPKTVMSGDRSDVGARRGKSA